jgi:DNA processing protein
MKLNDYFHFHNSFFLNKDILYQVALTLVPNIGLIHARTLAEHFGSAEAIFKAKKHALEKCEGIGEVRAKSIKEFTDFTRAEEEVAFIEKYKIEPLFLTDKNYPQRFLNCYDPPTLLYYRGVADLNASRILAIVGTRSNTDYGKQVTEQLVQDLSNENITIVSGLAFGIDAFAHKAALKLNLKTIGVVGHGLDTIYPAQHKSLAKEMVQQGGILTEFKSKTKPDKHNFPIRNRVVAGISDATIVVETSLKGGSLITAEMANSYNRDVFAFPGRSIDSKSAGCNHLIKNNKAVLLTDAQQLLELLGWQEKKIKPKQQKELFISLSPEETILVDILKEKELVHIDEIYLKSGLNSSSVAANMLNLEFQNVIASMPGKMYKLL